jgi:hypothetical protein
MSRLSAHSTVVASTTVSAVLALCMVGIGATAPAAASSLASSTSVGDESATSVDIAAAIGASLDAGTQAGARTGGGFTRSFGSSAAGASSAESVASAPDAASALSALSADSVFAASTQGASAVDTSFAVSTTSSPSLAVASEAAPAGASIGAAAGAFVTAVAPAAAPARTHAVVSAPALPLGSPRQVAQSLALNAGWGGSQWTCLSNLWQRESLFRTTARNYRSGAYGIPQALPASKMATAGADWRTNPATQVKWGLHYIAVRYGNPCNAWAHWKRYRSY